MQSSQSLRETFLVHLGRFGELYLSKKIPIRQTGRFVFVDADNVLVFDINHDDKMAKMILYDLRVAEFKSWLGIAGEEELGATPVPTLENKMFDRIVSLEPLVHVKSDFEMGLPVALVDEFKFSFCRHTELVEALVLLSGLIAIGRFVIEVAEKRPPKAFEVKDGDLEKVLIVQVIVIEATWSERSTVYDGFPFPVFRSGGIDGPNIFGLNRDGPYGDSEEFVVI